MKCLPLHLTLKCIRIQPQIEFINCYIDKNNYGHGLIFLYYSIVLLDPIKNWNYIKTQWTMYRSFLIKIIILRSCEKLVVKTDEKDEQEINYFLSSIHIVKQQLSHELIFDISINDKIFEQYRILNKLSFEYWGWYGIIVLTTTSLNILAT